MRYLFLLPLVALGAITQGDI